VWRNLQHEVIGSSGEVNWLIDGSRCQRAGHRHGVVCPTLAKWETVSGQFGGYLTWLPPKPTQNPTDLVKIISDMSVLCVPVQKSAYHFTHVA
jgi:hypothetical protein